MGRGFMSAQNLCKFFTSSFHFPTAAAVAKNDEKENKCENDEASIIHFN